MRQRKKCSPELIDAILKDYNKENFKEKRDYKNQYNRVGLSQRELAKKYNLSIVTIERIVQGVY